MPSFSTFLVPEKAIKTVLKGFQSVEPSRAGCCCKYACLLFNSTDCSTFFQPRIIIQSSPKVLIGYMSASLPSFFLFSVHNTWYCNTVPLEWISGRQSRLRVEYIVAIFRGNQRVPKLRGAYAVHQHTPSSSTLRISTGSQFATKIPRLDFPNDFFMISAEFISDGTCVSAPFSVWGYEDLFWYSTSLCSPLVQYVIFW